MKIQNQNLTVLLESEGPILTIRECLNTDNPLNIKRVYYLQIVCNNGADSIYTPLNLTALKLFFESRITVKELFLFGKSEKYYLQNGDKESELMVFDFKSQKLFDTLECGNSYFYQLSGMRMENPFELYETLVQTWIPLHLGEELVADFTPHTVLLNCEGSILQIVSSNRDEIKDERIYLKAMCKKGFLYAKTNDLVLEMYLRGTITLKELFQLANDNYIYEVGGQIQLLSANNEEFTTSLDSIRYAETPYFSIEPGIRNIDPLDQLRKTFHLFFEQGYR
jgi:hypothetical protein